MKLPLVLLWAAGVSLDAAAPAAPIPDASAGPTPTSVAPATHATPWPLVLPCAHPQRIRFDRVLTGEIIWSSTDGAATRTFVAQGDHPQPLRRDFPTGRLERVAASGVPTRASQDREENWLTLTCENRGIVSWGPCLTSTCTPRATYTAGPFHFARRVTRWTRPRPSPWGDDALEVHGSLFLNEIAYRKPEDQARARMAARFSRDIVTDFREMLAFACAQRRCSPLLAATDVALRSFLRAEDATLTPVVHQRTSRFGRDTTWTANGGGARLEVGCYDQDEATWVSCRLTVDLPGDLRATYYPVTQYARLAHDLELLGKGETRPEIGAIGILEAFPEAAGSSIEISDQALALRP